MKKRKMRAKINKIFLLLSFLYFANICPLIIRNNTGSVIVFTLADRFRLAYDREYKINYEPPPPFKDISYDDFRTKDVDTDKYMTKFKFFRPYLIEDGDGLIGDIENNFYSLIIRNEEAIYYLDKLSLTNSDSLFFSLDESGGLFMIKGKSKRPKGA